MAEQRPTERVEVKPTLDPQLEVKPEDRPKGVHAKVAWVMARLGRVPRNGWNDFHRYRYVEEADLVDMARPLMAAVGLVMIPTLLQDERHDRQTSRGKTTYLTRATIRYRVVDGDAGEEMPEWQREFAFDLVGEGEDDMDKGFYKAYTGANKYALMKLFQISQGDDPERSHTEAAAEQPPAQSGGQRQATPQPAEPEGDRRAFSTPERRDAARSYVTDSVARIRAAEPELESTEAEQLDRAAALPSDGEVKDGTLMDASKWLRDLQAKYKVEESPLEEERAAWDKPDRSVPFNQIAERLKAGKIKVDDMPAALAKITDMEEVRELKALDDRKTAQGHYDTRLFELTGEEPEPEHAAEEPEEEEPEEPAAEEEPGDLWGGDAGEDDWR